MSINIDGREYELVSLKGVHGDIDRDNPPYALEPVKQQPKWEVCWLHDSQHNDDICGVSVDFGDLRADQAQLIKQSVESLMHYLMGGSDIDLQQLALTRQAMKAWAIIASTPREKDDRPY